MSQKHKDLRVDDRDWTKLTFGEQVKMLEVEGYLVLPGVISESKIKALQGQLRDVRTKGTDYSERQRNSSDIAFLGGEITNLIANPPTTSILERLFGDDLVLMSYVYARSEPGHPGMALHTDGQPWGSEIFGYDEEKEKEYILSVIKADFAEAGDEDVFRKVKADLKDHNISDEEIRKKMDELNEKAKSELK